MFRADELIRKFSDLFKDADFQDGRNIVLYQVPLGGVRGTWRRKGAQSAMLTNLVLPLILPFYVVVN